MRGSSPSSCARVSSQAELAQLGAATAEELGGDASLEEQLAGIQQLTRFAEHFDCGTPAGSGDTNPFAPGASSAAKRRAEEAGLEGSSAEADEESKGKGKKPRERGTAWTEEEHKNFLIGLERYGKGDWRSISRQCVLTRTPAQVASHAQKYFIRQEAPIEPAKKANRRVSIHDINSLDQTMPARNQRKRRKAERAAAHAAAVAAATKGGPPPDVSAVSAATPSTAASGATVASQSAAVAASPDVAAAAAAAAAAPSAAAPAAAAAITAAAPAVLEVPGAGDKVGPGGPSSDCNGDSPSESGGSAPGSATGGSQPNSLPGSALSSPAKLEGEGAGAAPAAQATVESSA